uniref:Putative sphingolipid transporter spinster homolog 2 isoform X2 n=1 Tax=Rhizophora mucronata TaxID=61149 RepID=A0A2P2L7S8_RHIMU
MFYMCIPTGIALGYVYGGFVSLCHDISFRFVFVKLSLVFFEVT